MQMAFVQLLADSITIRDLYAKHAEQSSGSSARVFQLICQRHRVEHARLVDLLSAQVRALGGDALVMACDIADTSRIPRPPRRGEALDVQVQRLLNAHEIIAGQAIAMLTSPHIAAMHGLVSREAVLVASELILTGKLHVWLLAEHLRNVSHASQVAACTVCVGGRLVLPFC
jgi:starvation-inducible DNA-binding protein